MKEYVLSTGVVFADVVLCDDGSYSVFCDKMLSESECDELVTLIEL